jgi:hypothetical protein
MNFRNLFSRKNIEKESLQEESSAEELFERFYDEDIVEETVEKEEKCEIVRKSEPRDFFWKNDGSDPKFVDKLINIWYAIMCFLWFIIGTITYAPILFISKKIDAIFNNKKKSILIASIIYGFIIIAILFLFCFNRGEANVQNL